MNHRSGLKGIPRDSGSSRNALNPPIWYAMCWDDLRQDIRSFRCDRMHQVALQPQGFELRPWSDFQVSMEGNPTEKI
ncbi:MAG: WYL domain-containing protein [Rhodobacteraceae bacterium]|nr:WYL domain-containing protein [Paracoccaceae bacterium]